MSNETMINFVDADSGQEAFANVRQLGDVVGLAISLEHDGDIEVFLRKADLDRLVVALTDASQALGSEDQ
jgi:hypothetical protein